MTRDVKANVGLVERQNIKKGQAEELLLFELQAIARAAMASGIGEAAFLSAVRAAVGDLSAPSQPVRSKLLSAMREEIRTMFGSLAKTKSPWVFFSYSHADAIVVRAVASALEKHHVRVWIDQQELRVGDRLFDEIRSGLTNANAFVFFASKSAVESRWTSHEVEFAAARRITESNAAPVIPVVLDDVQLPPYLRDVLYIDLRDGNIEAAAARIAAAVHRVTYDEIGRSHRR